MKMENKIQYLPLNLKGRDFIIGDLHGMTELLEALLKEVKFNPECDRLFSVGDLIDRGLDSPAALSYLEKPWFYAVLGNHEEMLLDYLLPRNLQKYDLSNDRGEDHSFLANGGEDWYPKNPVSEEIKKKMLDLPLMFVVGKDTPSRYHIVHASLVKQKNDEPPFVSIFLDQEIDSGLPWWKTRYISGFEDFGLVRDGLLWDRTLYYEKTLIFKKSLTIKNLFGILDNHSPVYVGHSPVEDPLILGNHHFIDTGAYKYSDKNSGLTIVEAGKHMTLTAGYVYEEVKIRQRVFKYFGTNHEVVEG